MRNNHPTDEQVLASIGLTPDDPRLHNANKAEFRKADGPGFIVTLSFPEGDPVEVPLRAAEAFLIGTILAAHLGWSGGPSEDNETFAFRAPREVGVWDDLAS